MRSERVAKKLAADTNTMMSEQQITERLVEIGYNEAEVETALRDVGQIIIARTAADYMKRFPETTQTHLRTLPEADVQAYLETHKAELPHLAQEDFDKLHDETWEEYFEAMSE